MILSEFLLVQTLNGLSFGALLFLLASGLSLIYGVMKIVNIAHGSYFMLGAYVGLSVILRTKSFILGAFAGGLVVGVVGLVMERGFLRKFPLQALPQMMITLGFALVFRDLALLIWGGDPYTLPCPAFLKGRRRSIKCVSRSIGFSSSAWPLSWPFPFGSLTRRPWSGRNCGRRWMTMKWREEWASTFL